MSQTSHPVSHAPARTLEAPIPSLDFYGAAMRRAERGEPEPVDHAPLEAPTPSLDFYGAAMRRAERGEPEPAD